MKKYSYIIICIIIIIFLNANQKNILQSVKESNFENYLSDTIKPVIDYTFVTACAKQFDGYFFSFGYHISNYYTVCDYYSFNKDTIVILSPKVLTPEASSWRIQNERIINNRLLIIKNKKKKSIYKNVIENDIGYGTCVGEFLEMNSKGFCLHSTKGQACKFSYKIFVNYMIDDFYITEIALESFCPFDNKPKKAYIKYKENEFNLKDYDRNLPDSLRTVYEI